MVGASGHLHDDTAALLAAMSGSGRRYVVLYPNNDTGGGEILRAIREVEHDPAFRVLPSMKFESYLTALRHAAVLVGNSSSGIHEAPVYGVPTVNVGGRQHNRFDHSSIQHVPFDADAIMKAVDHVWGTRFEPTMHFGSGTSASSFVAVLRRPDTWATTVLKQFSD